ncbi:MULTISPECIES: cobalamin-dependent protein [Eubacterium]|uniref:B12 binding domain-containing protein n=2 Tax=Eubacterium TaxID=1730 RepID=A0A1H4DVF4_9FIRM|nr:MULTISPECIES: cobalamin-dependent protein [Eubacterium]SDX96266.1 B12 binding domain-containing protein [Eubacterium barkeri]SEA76744.1 B12 binding domain-containing protein [Eubacterium aggregans]
MLPMKKVFRKIIDGDEVCTVEICREFLDAGVPPMEILEKAMIPAMDHCGVLLRSKKSFIPQVLMSTRAMQAGIDVLRPYLSQSQEKMITAETIIIGTVQGDIHSIGKSLVSIMLESVGFTVVDLGTNISGREFIEAIIENKAQYVSLSAMLTTAMISMREIVQEINAYPFDWPVKILVGGAPITKAFAAEIGADFADNAADCVEKVLTFKDNTD